METKHTPGPWAVYQSRGNSRLRVMSDAVPYDVATMNHAGNDEAEAANAHLIAAAPEMLDALRYMVANAEAEGWSGLMLGDARTAISKAEGRA